MNLFTDILSIHFDIHCSVKHFQQNEFKTSMLGSLLFNILFRSKVILDNDICYNTIKLFMSNFSLV